MTEILVLGVIISIIFYELTDISPGGIIVPGLMVIYIGKPIEMLYTVIIAVLAYFIVKLFSRRFLVFGKRRFVLLIIVSLLLNVLFNLFFGAIFRISVSIIGYTAAGIIANNIYKQGIVRTVPSLAIVVCIVELVVILLSAVGVTI